MAKRVSLSAAWMKGTADVEGERKVSKSGKGSGRKKGRRG